MSEHRVMNKQLVRYVRRGNQQPVAAVAEVAPKPSALSWYVCDDGTAVNLSLAQTLAVYEIESKGDDRPYKGCAVFNDGSEQILFGFKTEEEAFAEHDRIVSGLIGGK